MAEAEFRESEVLWPDNRHCISTDAPPYHRQQKTTADGRKGLSSPVDIPKNNILSRSWAPCFDNQGDGDNDEGELSKEEDMIPPHILVVRRVSEKIAFSVCTGNGRMLEGRDLQRVRNSVLKMTGFLESARASGCNGCEKEEDSDRVMRIGEGGFNISLARFRRR